MNGLILTGCAGFIGLNFLKKFLIDRSYRSVYHIIISVDKLGYASIHNQDLYKGICSSNDIITVDSNINDIEKMKSYYDPTSQTECHIQWDVLNFASNSHVDNSIKSPSELYNENCSITSNLLKWIGSYSKVKNFYQISTDECYGDISFEKIKDKNNYFTKNSPILPSNPYSASKVAQDMFLHSIHKTFGMNVCIIRMANQFGKHQHNEKMIPASLLRVKNNESIKVYGNGKNMRQWTYVEDTVKIINNIIKMPFKKPFEILHISDERNLLSNNDLVLNMKNILKLKGIDCTIEYIEDRKGHDLGYALKSDFATYFTEDLDKTLNDTITWYMG